MKSSLNLYISFYTVISWIIKASLVTILGETTTLEMKRNKVVVKKGDDESSQNTTTSSYVVRTIRYAECQRNVAANVGGFAVDGCREFMPSGDEGSGGELTCAACGCHRNFHRREEEAVEAVNDHISCAD
ncbi:hypothetical protein DM860_014035 [Cuscuta australis]|uniref:ZF-HD dimerization-type domain-containing protein n=1 Tax=Cuscuta australis TaxID=267555 RepID=A0A328DSM5_9ASTE|nr:hypothetical protein DM860_014035 [Cuscuta australis]